ncbi:MAG: TIM barrel protein [Anaerolineae bacterium]|nr:TIM barrel protein [Thermoflexales bacterium]MDW8395966.1 TIM barrel protein [Anaerolineae bacterium]
MTIRVGNAPCSWGTLEFEGMSEGRIGYIQMLDELAETGYVGTELGDWGFMPTDPVALGTVLRQRGLTLTGAFVPIAFTRREAWAEGQVHALQVAHLLAALADPDFPPFVVLSDENGADPIRLSHAGRITPEMGLRPEQWMTFAEGVNQVARAIHQATGLPVVFHHHCAGYVETPDEIARLLDLTDPDLVGLVFDTGHYAFGSGAPSAAGVMAGLQRFWSRVRYLHFKDCSPSVAAQAVAEGWDYHQAVRHGVFCELGQGCVPFESILRWLETQGYHGFITVEQDVLPGMGTPKTSAQRNRAFLHKIGL